MASPEKGEVVIKTNRRKHKRGGVFTKKQLEIIRTYKESKKMPDRITLSHHKFPLDRKLGDPKPLFKAASKRLTLSGGTLRHKSGKKVIPIEKFIRKIKKAHEGDDTEADHLTYHETLRKLSKTYTIGKRTYGMSKKLIEAVVKSCNSGSCHRNKLSWRKKDYGDFVQKFRRKYKKVDDQQNSQSSKTQDGSQNSQTEPDSENTQTEQGSQTVLNNRSSEKVVKPVKKKSSELRKMRRMPTLVSMLQKPILNPIGCSTSANNEPETKTPLGTVTVNQQQNSATKKNTSQLATVSTNQQQGSSKTNTSQVRIQPKIESKNSQFQLGVLFPIVNSATSSTAQKTICIPLCTQKPPTSTATLNNQGNKTSINITKTVTLSEMKFSSLLQTMAKNSQAGKPSATVVSSKVNNLTPVTIDPNAPGQPSLGVRPNQSNTDKQKQSNIQSILKQALDNKKAESQSEPKPPSQKKIKFVKLPKTKNQKWLDNETKSQDDSINSNDENNNKENSWIDQNKVDDGDKDKDMEMLRKGGVYKNCLKSLCNLSGPDFEIVMDKLHQTMFSEGPDPMNVPFYPLPDPPYPNIWYFYPELCQETNVFNRIMLVTKDIKIDLVKCTMLQSIAQERLKRKFSYLEEMIERNRLYLNVCNRKRKYKEAMNN